MRERPETPFHYPYPEGRLNYGRSLPAYVDATPRGKICMGFSLRDYHSVAADRILMTLTTVQSGGATYVEAARRSKPTRSSRSQSNRQGIPMSYPTLPICHPVGRHIRLSRETIILSRSSACCRASANPYVTICALCLRDMPPRCKKTAGEARGCIRIRRSIHLLRVDETAFWYGM